jgi:hypothetical protein
MNNGDFLKRWKKAEKLLPVAQVAGRNLTIVVMLRSCCF